jgi:hypothetical protein
MNLKKELQLFDDPRLYASAALVHDMFLAFLPTKSVHDAA